MKAVGRESGKTNMPFKSVDESIEETESEEDIKKDSWLPYIRQMVKKLIDSGNRFPIVKKATGATFKFQITGHQWISEILQGYWERNKKIYTHRARSDYRALYLGTIAMLEEETYLTGKDNKEEISQLEGYLEEKEYRHKNNRQKSMLRAEIKTCLAEVESGEISEERFDEEMAETTRVYALDVGEGRAIQDIKIIMEQEEVRHGNRVRQSRHREYERKAKRISVVEKSGY